MIVGAFGALILGDAVERDHRVDLIQLDVDGEVALPLVFGFVDVVADEEINAAEALNACIDDRPALLRLDAVNEQDLTFEGLPLILIGAPARLTGKQSKMAAVMTNDAQSH